MAVTISEIRKKSQYGKNRVRNAYRFISVYITAIFIRLPITPNQVTAMWVSLVVLGSFLIFFYPTSYPLKLLGAFFIFLMPILDFVDGELARWRGQFSLTWGEYMDWIGGWLSHTLPTISLFLAEFYIRNRNVSVLYVGLACLMGYVMFEFLRLENIKIFGPGKGEKTSKVYAPALNRIYLFFRRAFLIEYYHTLFFLAVLFNLGFLFLAYYAIGFNLMWIGRAYYDYKTIAQRRIAFYGK